MLEKIKLALRLTDDIFDAEIKALIAACKADLKMAGVICFEDNDPLFLHAVTLFCKANFGFANVSDKHLQVYESLKTPLRLAAGGADV